MIPARVRGLEAAVAEHGAIARRLARLYMVGDPPVDAIVQEQPDAIGKLGRWMARPHAAPSSVRAVLADCDEQVASVPHDRIARGAWVLRSLGPLGPLILVTYCLPQAYAEPAGNKPLIATGDLVKQAPQRLDRTAAWWRSITSRDPIGPGSLGYRSTLHVRFAHASVRRRLSMRPDWSVEALGVPIPQTDTAATGLLFGPVLLRGIAQLGGRVEPDDADCVSELIAAVSALLGVRPELRTRTHREGLARFDLLTGWQEAPDADSRRLVHALFDVPRHRLGRRAGPVVSRALHAIAHELLPDRLPVDLDIRRGRGTGRVLRAVTPYTRHWMGGPDGRRAATHRRVLDRLIRPKDGRER